MATPEQKYLEDLRISPMDPMYDPPIGEIPAVPIGEYSSVDGTTGAKKPVAITEALIHTALAAEAEGEITVTERPQGAHNVTIFRHPRWLSVGGIATALGVTATTMAGLGTIFVIQDLVRKYRRNTDK